MERQYIVQSKEEILNKYGMLQIVAVSDDGDKMPITIFCGDSPGLPGELELGQKFLLVKKES